MYPGWTVDLVLNMPAVTSLAMLKQGRRIHAYRLAEQCDIAAIPLCTIKYYERLKNMYIGLSARESKEQRQTVALDAGSEEAKKFMMNLFALKKSKGGVVQ